MIVCTFFGFWFSLLEAGRSSPKPTAAGPSEAKPAVVIVDDDELDERDPTPLAATSTQIETSRKGYTDGRSRKGKDTTESKAEERPRRK